MVIKKHIIEIFENNKHIGNLTDLNDWEDYFYNYVDKHNYKIIYEGKGGSTGVYLLVNWIERKSVILSYKSYIGYKDKHGKKLYYEDIIKDEFGHTSGIHQHYDSDKYYFRINGERWLSWTDYDIENFKKFEKVEDVLEYTLKNIR